MLALRRKADASGLLTHDVRKGVQTEPALGQMSRDRALSGRVRPDEPDDEGSIVRGDDRYLSSPELELVGAADILLGDRPPLLCGLKGTR